MLAGTSLGQTEGGASSGAHGIPEITLGASDYAFQWPESIEAGRVAVTMENRRSRG